MKLFHRANLKDLDNDALQQRREFWSSAKSAARDISVSAFSTAVIAFLMLMNGPLATLGLVVLAGAGAMSLCGGASAWAGHEIKQAEAERKQRAEAATRLHQQRKAAPIAAPQAPAPVVSTMPDLSAAFMQGTAHNIAVRRLALKSHAQALSAARAAT